ncbi:MAG: shikimate dehydrogenase family protein [Thermoleophilaceae bacterium]
MGRTLLGVAGFPVGHSRSPAMHRAALAKLGLDWRYVKVPLPPHLFEEAVRALPRSGFRGLNVTVPHKEAARRMADQAGPAVAAIGAANTLTFEWDGSIGADNTDAPGFLAALGTDPRGLEATVLCAGGSARAVAWALADAGALVSVWNRTPERGRALAEDLGVEWAARPTAGDLVVNCTSVGLDQGEPGDAIDRLGLADVDPPATVVDLVYGAAPTPVERWARCAGARFVPGLEVLVQQGVLSLERWTGREAPVTVMRRALA